VLKDVIERKQPGSGLGSSHLLKKGATRSYAKLWIIASVCIVDELECFQGENPCPVENQEKNNAHMIERGKFSDEAGHNGKKDIRNGCLRHFEYGCGPNICWVQGVNL